MKKLGKALICTLLTSSILFTGCSLVQRNTERYLNRTVATADSITISKQDLISAYNSYGYQYASQMGYSTKDAVKRTLDSLIDRQIVLQKAKELIKENDNEEMVYNGERVIFNKNVWQNDVWKSTFEAVNKQIANIEDEIREEQDIEKPESKEEENQEFDAYKPYEKKVSYEDGVWSKVKTELDEAEEEAKTIADFVQDETGDADISARAFKRYVKKLQLNYKSKHLTVSDLETVSQAQLDGLYVNFEMSPEEKISFLYELERIYKAYDDDKYITELQNVYEQDIQTIDDNFNKKVVNYYKQLVENSYETYMQDTLEDSYTAYVKAMQDDYSKVYYHRDYGLNDNGEKRQFVAVSHVLIKLSDEQISELKELKTKLETGVIGQQEYDEKCEEIKNATIVHARDEDGKETETTKTVAEVLQEIKTDLAQYQNTQDKLSAFSKYIYKYGQDSGSINAEKYYAVNLDTTVTDTMTKNFADASRELAKESEDGGNLSEPIFVSQDNYTGFHIILNAGVIKNDLTIEQIRNLDYTDADYLYNKTIKIDTNKSLYDMIYEKIYASTYSAYQRSIVETAKSNLQVVYYVSAYEDLY